MAGTVAYYVCSEGDGTVSALLVKPGRVMSPDELARHAWGVTYHAIRHRSRLVVSIKRLRDALGSDVISSVGGGCCLSAHSWAVLEPIHGPAEPSPDRARRRQDAGERLQGRA